MILYPKRNILYIYCTTYVVQYTLIIAKAQTPEKVLIYIKCSEILLVRHDLGHIKNRHITQGSHTKEGYGYWLWSIENLLAPSPHNLAVSPANKKFHTQKNLSSKYLTLSSTI